MLTSLGMTSSLSDQDLEHGCLYPSHWSGKAVVFLPSGGGEGEEDEDACWSLDKVYAAWTLATPEQRSRCYFAVVASSAGGVVEGDAVITLLRGDAAGRAYSVDSRAIGCPPPDLLARLGNVCNVNSSIKAHTTSSLHLQTHVRGEEERRGRQSRSRTDLKTGCRINGRYVDSRV